MTSPLEAASDTQLQASIERRSADALAVVYQRHGGAVRNLVLRMSSNDAIADDVTQDVFVGLWRSPEKFDAARGSLRTYLLTRARSRCIDVQRSEQSRRNRERRDVVSEPSRGDDSGMDSELDSMVVTHALSVLPASERQAIDLAYFGGHTYREVADLLGEPEGTVKSRIRAGLERLRTELKRSAGGA